MSEETLEPEEENEGEESRMPKSAMGRYWEKVGGGSFTISILVHAAIALLAVLLVWRTAVDEKPENIDFLSGGGGGSQGETKINQKKQRMMVNKTPAVKLSSAASSNISLPDTNSTLADMSALSKASGMMSGTPGSGGGIGGGKGGGKGPGNGMGFGPGSGIGFTANFLGIKAGGNNFIFCIDTSGSMRTNLKAEGIDALLKELTKVITELPASVNFNLICFGANGDIFKEKSVPASNETKKEALAFLSGYYGKGSTDFGRTRTEKFGPKGVDDQGVKYIPLMPNDVKELAGTGGSSRIDLAMVAAFERKPSTIFVLSDGAPGTQKKGEATPMDKDDLIKLIHEKYKLIMGSAKLDVFTITIDGGDAGGKEGQKFMSSLARKFGGKYKEVKASKL